MISLMVSVRSLLLCLAVKESSRSVSSCWSYRQRVKVKVGFLYSTMLDQEQCALTISEVAVDWQEPMLLQHKCGHPLLMDIGPAVAAGKHTTAPISHTRPSPHKHSRQEYCGSFFDT